MKIFGIAILAGVLLFAEAAHADNGRGLTPEQVSQFVDDVRRSSSVTDNVCKNPRDFRSHVSQNRGAKQLPKLAGPELRRINKMAHDPEACSRLTVHYIGEPEQVGRIVRRTDEAYCIKRITQVGVLGTMYGMPVLYVRDRETRYLLQPCE